MQSNRYIVADGVEVVPYTIWGNNLKVVLRVSAELKFHDVTHSARPHQIIKTSWINYVFSDETGMCFEWRFAFENLANET